MHLFIKKNDESDRLCVGYRRRPFAGQKQGEKND